MASSSSLSQKVCVVCRRSVVTSCRENWIYIVDLKSAAGDYFSRRDPTFRVRDDGSLSYPCFCVLGSTLYVFQGYDWDKLKRLGKTVYTHPLPSSDTANLKLTRSDLSVAKAPLKDIKWNPTAVPTPDGKQILVVPTGFRRWKDDWICSLELYDPSRQTSTVIRALPLECQSLLVRSVKFIGPRTVLFWTMSGPYKTACWRLDYDLQGGDPKWVEMEWAKNIGVVPRHDWWFTSSSTVRDQCREWYDKYQPLSGDDLSSFVVDYDITPLSDDGVDSSFCTLRMGRTLRPFVMLDVYKHREQVDEESERQQQQQKRGFETDEGRPRAPFEKDKAAAITIDDRFTDSITPGVELVKSIRFFDARQMEDEDDSFTELSFFSIPTTPA